MRQRKRVFNTANRGMPFEELLEYTNQRYMSYKEAIVWKIPTEFIPLRNAYGKIVSCKVSKKSCVDYLGRYKYVPLAIEAKHTSSDRISYAAVQYHQALFLESFKHNGYGFSAVLVSFKLERFFLVPWPFWEAARSAWENRQNKNSRKAEKVTVNCYGIQWETNGMATVSAEELPKEFEVKTDHKYGLPYLTKIEDYITILRKKDVKRDNFLLY